MESEIFKAGTMPGAPNSEFEIKFLICYLLQKTAQSVTFNQLAVTFQKTGFVNYFEFSDLLSELLEQGHIEKQTDGLSFVLTPHGEKAAESFYREIPPAVRERCEEELKKQLKLARRTAEYGFWADKTEDGYRVTLEIPDMGTPLLRLSMFVPTKELCEDIRRRFLNDPLTLYKGVVALTTGDVRSVAPLLPDGEDLFA